MFLNLDVNSKNGNNDNYYHLIFQ